MDAQGKLYKDGFNSGYFLAEHDPQLARVFLDVAMSQNEPSEYAYGLSTGHDVYISERIISQNKEETERAKPEKALTPEDKYIKGFNSGYLLSKHDPELAQILITPQESPSEYHEGLTAGKNEHEMEKIQDRLNEISKNRPTKDDKDKER